MIVVDSSAWIEFLRATQSLVHRELARLIGDDGELATTEVVCFEILAGARDSQHLEQLRRTLRRYPVLRLDGLGSFEGAAALYVDCRRSGLTVRKPVDCLIAVVAIEHGLQLLAQDRDFDAIASVSSLELYDLPTP